MGKIEADEEKNSAEQKFSLRRGKNALGWDTWFLVEGRITLGRREVLAYRELARDRRAITL